MIAPVGYDFCPVGYTLWATEITLWATEITLWATEITLWATFGLFSLVISAGCSPALTYPDCPDFPDVR